MFEDLKRQILGDPESRGPLAQHLVFHETFKEGGILSDFYDQYGDDDRVGFAERDSYIRDRLSSDFSGDISDKVSDRIFHQSLESQIYGEANIGQSGVYRVKALINDFSQQARQSIAPGDLGDIDEFVGQSLFKRLFGNQMASTNSLHYQTMDLSTPKQGTDELERQFLLQTTSSTNYEDVDFYMRGVGRDPSKRRGLSGSFGYSLDNNMEAASRVDRTVYNTRFELARLKGKSYGDYSPEDAISYLHNQIDGGAGYLNKVGIGPIVSLVESSNEFLDMDMFQFQNESIGDMYYNKIMEKAAELAGDGSEFKVRIRIAQSDEGSLGSTGHNILGPNIIQLQRLAGLRDKLISTLEAELRSKGIEATQANELARARVLKNFQVVQASRKDHRKLLINEKMAIIGSANFTAPLGSSIHQEGSTYEAVRVLTRNRDFDFLFDESLSKEQKVIRRDEVSYALERKALAQAREDYGADNPKFASKSIEYRDRAIQDFQHQLVSNKLYLQTKRLSEKIQSSPQTKFMVSGEKNIGLSHDIWTHLSRTLLYAEENTHTKLKMMLDQPFILHFGTSSYDGEMGRDASLGSGTREAQYRQHIQDRLYNLLGSDRAEVVVDIRNYRDRVIDPTYEAVRKVLGANVLHKNYDGNLEKLVNLSDSFEVRRQKLTQLFGASNYQFGSDDQFSSMDQLVRQVLIVTSGNIKLSTQPKQHLKSYGLFGKDGLISYYMGSSNLGPGSLAMSNTESESRIANEELGLMLATAEVHKRNRDGDEFALSLKEEITDLLHSTLNFNRQWNTLTGSTIKQGVSTRPSWEKDVDTAGVERLAANLEQVNKALGFEAMTLTYMLGGTTGSARVGVHVDFNMGALTGLSNAPRVRYKFAPLKYAAGDDRGGFVYAVDQAKAIGRSRFVNNRASESIKMPFGIGERDYIPAQSSATLDSVQSTSVRMATLVGEIANKSMVALPTQYLRGAYGDDALSATFIDYLEWLGTGRSRGGEWLVNEASDADITKLSNDLMARLGSNGSNGILTKVRELTGTNTAEVNARRTEHLIQVSARLEDLRAAAPEDRYSILGSMLGSWRNQDTVIWQDLMLDIVRSHNDYGYENFVRESLRGTSKYMLEDTVTQGKQSAYIGPQGYGKLSLLGINDSSQYQKFISLTEQKDTTGLGRILEFARFIPLTYGPTSSLHTPGAFRSVAEGGGSRPSNDAWTGISMFGMNKQELGNIVDIEIMNSMGVGFTTTKSEVEKYLSTIEGVSDTQASELADKIYTGKDRDAKLVTYLFSPKKISQIPQRLKNVMGSQAMHVIDPRISSMMERKDSKLPTYLDNQLDNFRKEVASLLQEASNSPLTDKQAYERAKVIVEDNYTNSLVFGSEMRKVMSMEAHRIIEAERKALQEELGIDNLADPNLASRGDLVVRQLLRSKLINRDLASPGMKGFTGHKGDQVTLIQLGGAHTDYFFANPVYGSKEGLREGFIDRQEKRLKASMLSSNWTDGSNTKIIAWAGDYVAYDKDKARVVVVHGNKSDKPGKISSYSTDMFSPSDLRTDYIDSMGVRDIFKDVADNAKGISGESSFATYKGAAWFSEGEDSIEYTLNSRWLNADPEGNQSVFELSLLRTKKAGGGARFESFGSLFKAVSYFTTKDTIQHVLDKMESSRREGGPGHSFDEGIDIHKVLGLGGPAHLKSYSFEHGATILLNESKLAKTLSQKNEDLAMGLLLGFGPAFLENQAGVDKRQLRQVKRLLYDRAVSNTMGSYYKELATKATLMANFDKSLENAAKDYIKDNNLNTTVESLLSNERYRSELVAEVVATDLMKKASFSTITTPDLLGINLTDITEGLMGRGNLKTKVRSLLSNQSGLMRDRGYALYKDFKERSAINITTALDINAQLATQGDMSALPSDVDLRDNRVLLQMASIAGGYNLGRMTVDEDYRQEVAANLKGQISSYKVLALYTSIGFSQSKVAMSKKYEANLEYQYMLKSFPANFRMLRSGGKMEHIKRAVATIYKSTSVSEEVLISDIEASMGDLDIKPFHSLEFTSYGTKETLGKAKFLSIFGGSKNLSEISSYRKDLLKLSSEKRKEMSKLMETLVVAEQERQDIQNSRDEGRKVGRLNAWKTKYNSLYDNLLSLMISKGDTLRGSVLEHQLMGLARQLEADSDKGFGTGQAKDFLDAMEAVGQKSFMFSLPSISGTEYTSDGKVRLSYSYDNPITVFMPDAQMLKNLGVEFGSYIADELKSTMILSTGFAPGTSMSLIRDKMALAHLRGKNEVEIAQEDLTKVQKYWSTASAMTEMLALSSSGTISKRAFAGENRMPGVVSFAAASFLVPKDTAVVAQAALERHGLNTNPSRERAIKSMNAEARTLLNKRAKRHSALQQGKNINKRAEAYQNQTLSNLYLQSQGLARGASPEATKMLASVRNESIFMRQEIEKLERIRTTDTSTYRRRVVELQDRNRRLFSEVRSHDFRGKGDYYVDKVARQESTYWKNKLALLSLEIDEAEPGKDKQRSIKKRRRILRQLEAAPWLIKDLSVGSRYKPQVRRGSFIEVEDLENSTRGRAGVSTWDQDHFTSITKGDVALGRKERDLLFLHMLEKRAEKFNALSRAYKERIQGDYIASRDKSIDNANGYQDLDRLGRKISALAREFRESLSQANPNLTYDDAAARLNRYLARLDTSDLTQAFITRSSPSGGTEHQRQLFGILRSINYIDERAKKANEDSSDTYLMRTDYQRNSTLTLLSPLSQVTMALGDFDGDPYTVIFSGLADMANSVEKLDDKRKAIEFKVSRLEKKRQKLIENFNRQGDDGDYDRRMVSIIGKEISKITSSIDNLTELSNRANEKRLGYILKMEMANDMMNPEAYDSAVRKEVANYMGLNAELFGVSTNLNEDGMYSLFDMSIDLLPSFIEQGSGLFGGIEGEGHKIVKLNSLLERIIVEDPSSVTQGHVQVRKDRESIERVIHELATEDGPNKSFYTTLNMMDNVRGNLIDSIEAQFEASEYTTEEYRESLGRLATGIYQSVYGLSEAQSKIGQGAGITLEYSVYDFLTNVLGKAGGDLLGKTYNTLIGTLYADSPLIAMAHILGEGGTTRENIRKGVRGSFDSDAEANAFLAHIDESADAAAATQGFMKNIHQLLRDSIKFKNEGGDLKASLEEKARQYSRATPEQKEILINEIAATMGPGPGLSALMNLNTLLVEKDRIAAISSNDIESLKESLSSTFGLAGFVSDSDKDAFTSVQQELSIVSGRSIDSLSTLDVIYYKVSEDLKSLAAAYRYEKYVGDPGSDSKADRILSHGQLERTALSQIRGENEGITNWLRGLEVLNGDEVDTRKLISSMGEIYGGSTLREILDLRIQSDIDDWYSKLPANRRRRVAVISDDRYDSLGTNQKAMVRYFIEEEDRQTSKWLGHHGEGLDRFSTLSQVRMDIAGVMSGDTTSLSSQFQEADVAMTMLNLATQDKLNAKAQALFFNEIVRTAGIVEAPPKREDPKYQNNEELYKADREEYDKRLKTQVLKRISGIPLAGEDGEGASSFTQGVSKDKRDAFSIALDKFLDREITIEIPGQGPVTYKSGIDFISYQMEETAAGQRASMVRAMVDSENVFHSESSGGGQRKDVAELAQAFLADPDDVSSMYQIVQQLGALGLGGQSPASVLMAEKRQRMQQYDAVLKKDYALVERETAKAQRASNVLDVLAPLALTLIGGAVLEGGITEDMLGQVAGASFMTLAYSKQGIAKRAWSAGFGSGFRITNAIAQAGDNEEGFVNYLKQEAAFSFGALAIAPAMEMAVNRTLNRSIDPNIRHRDAVKASMNPLSYKLKQGTVLDVDRFTSTKAVSGSVSSALLSAVIGMTMAGVVGEMVAAPKKIRTGSAIDLAIESLASTIQRTNNHRLEAQLQRDVVTVVDEEGTEYMDHEKEVGPMEAIYDSSIDYTTGINYANGTPPYVMVGVSIE